VRLACGLGPRDLLGDQGEGRAQSGGEPAFLPRGVRDDVLEQLALLGGLLLSE
jgi:hypothetical protein